ncbi:MAG: hypothetical protein R2939_20770 [Kofleriaceae bacterium]
MRAAALLALALAASCGQDAIGLTPGGGTSYGRAELTAAIEGYVAAGRTPAAFAALVDGVRGLLDRMDATVAAEAERKLLVLALDPVEAAAPLAAPARATTLATTVWPFALGPSLSSRSLSGRPELGRTEYRVLPDEDAAAYLLRLCDGPLAADCRHAVPEAHGVLVEAGVLRRMTERARNAVSACYPCAGDPAWAAAVARWEALERDAAAIAPTALREGAPGRWPVAGAAAEDVAVVASAQLATDGRLTLDGVELPPVSPGAAIAAAAGTGAVGLQAAPATPWAQVEAVVRAARAAGATVLVDARAPTYPWPVRRYRLPPGGVPGLRSFDPLQVALRTLDHAAELKAAGAAAPPR